MSVHKINNRVGKFIKNPKKGLFVLALPILVSMMVQALYNITDTAFIGRLGSEAIAALTFSFPLFFILIAINMGLSTGMSSRISRFLGEKNKKQAENTAIHGIIFAVGLSLVVSVLGIVFLEPIFSLLGAEGNVLSLAIDYMFFILLGSIFLILVGIFTNIFNAQGDSKTSMKIYAFTLILNIILDPIFIFVLGYGVKGAAIATSISFFCGFLLAIYYIKTKSALEIKLSSFSFSWDLVKQIFFIGIPAGLTMFTMSVSMIFINRILASFGTDYVAAFGISFRLDSLAIMPLVAFSLAVLPLTGMLYGAKKYDLLKKTNIYALKIVFTIAVTMGFILYLIPELLLRIFTSDANLLMLGSSYMRVIVFSYPLAAISMVIGRIIQGLGKGMPSLIINFTRSLLVAIPLAYILIFVFGYGYLSIPYAMVTGGIVSSLIALIWLKYTFDKLEI